MRCQIAVVSLLVFLVSTYSQETFAESEEVLIPAGKFRMGCSQGDTACDRDEGSPGGIEVNVPAFYIDRYEVTVEQYAACIEDGSCQQPKGYTRNKYCNFGPKLSV